MFIFLAFQFFDSLVLAFRAQTGLFHETVTVDHSTAVAAAASAIRAAHPVGNPVALHAPTAAGGFTDVAIAVTIFADGGPASFAVIAVIFRDNVAAVVTARAGPTFQVDVW